MVASLVLAPLAVLVIFRAYPRTDLRWFSPGWHLVAVAGIAALALLAALAALITAARSGQPNIIWLGIGEFSKVFLIYLAIFAPMAIAARAGVRSVAIEQMHAAYAMGASRGQVISQVVMKAALPEIFTGMRIGIGVGWTTLVAAEMVAAQEGLGFMVLNAAQFLDSATVIMGIIVIGAFAFGFDLLIRYLERVLIPWKGRV